MLESASWIWFRSRSFSNSMLTSYKLIPPPQPLTLILRPNEPRRVVVLHPALMRIGWVIGFFRSHRSVSTVVGSFRAVSNEIIVCPLGVFELITRRISVLFFWITSFPLMFKPSNTNGISSRGSSACCCG